MTKQNLTKNQKEILGALNNQDPIGISIIYEKTKISKQTISNNLYKLLAKDLVEKIKTAGGEKRDVFSWRLK